MVTVDTILLRFRRQELEILLVQRGYPPFQGHWALPGGFIEMEETLIDAAQRELNEETKLNCDFLVPLLFAGDPGRDPRGRTITAVFCGILSPPFPAVQAGGDARETKWFAISHLPKLAFDHQKIIGTGIEQLMLKAFWQLWIFAFLPETFARSELENLAGKLFGSTKHLESLLQTAKNLSYIELDQSGNIKQSVKLKKLVELNFNLCCDAWHKKSNKYP
jgi:8-oxo-dGTP diphosphatase